MTIAIDTVCSDADLADEIGGTELLARLLPDGTDSVTARERALADVLRSLQRRTPPIEEADITDPTELRQAVAFGALERLYRASMASPESVFAEQRRIYERRFQAECQGLRPTLQGVAIGAASAIKVSRR